jgi:hypothetical protein
MLGPDNGQAGTPSRSGIRRGFSATFPIKLRENCVNPAELTGMLSRCSNHRSAVVAARAPDLTAMEMGGSVL